MNRTITYTKAINEALHTAMEVDSKVLCYGLGVDDPKHIFGTTTGLKERFGNERVFDVPASENAMTGVAVGAGLRGFRSVIVHQRVDFVLLAMDQLVNSAAKWHYTFGGQSTVPIVIRLIIGRGWGQGPTHSQSLQAWFAHIPGLKVVMPSRPRDAKGLLLRSIFDDNPVIFLEHRWLHNQEADDVPEGNFQVPIGKADVIREGKDITLVGMSYMTIEALRAAEVLDGEHVSCEVVDLRSINPLDWDTIFGSVRKTGRLVVLDTGSATGSVGGEIVARVAMELFSELHCAPSRIAMPDVPTPSSFALTEDFYPSYVTIVDNVSHLLGKPIGARDWARSSTPHDIPGAWFRGPF